TTAGQIAHAIVAQSIGGGGGSGGEGAPGIQAWTTNELANEIVEQNETIAGLFTFSKFTEVKIDIGGSAGASGDGGDVSVTNAGVLTVNGVPGSEDEAAAATAAEGEEADGLELLSQRSGGMGIFAQSVGGGGGSGGAGAGGLKGAFTLGRGGSGGGDGGKVEVRNVDRIQTFGADGTAIFAQSVGGGGGAAGEAGVAFLPGDEDVKFGIGLAIEGNAGAGGDGGDVFVSSTGEIVTQGAASHGVVAQSVGGGGGVLGSAEEGTDDRSYVPFGLAGSLGGVGTGGVVNVTVDAPITVSGEASVGIVAQSANGRIEEASAETETDAPGNTTVTVRAAVSAIGERGRGVLIGSSEFGEDAGEGDESVGGGGAVSLSVARAGSITIGDAAAEAVAIVGGSSQMLTIDGTIVAPMADDVRALRIDEGRAATITVGNTGSLIGSIQVMEAEDAEGTTVLTSDNGYLGLGQTTSLGGGSFTSGGTISPGDKGTVIESTITADEVKIDGIYVVDLNPRDSQSGDPEADRIFVTAAEADVSGTIQANVLQFPRIRDLSSLTRFPILTASGLDAEDFTLGTAPAVLNFALDVEDGENAGGPDTLFLSYGVDPTPNDLAGAAPNQRAFGEYVGGLLLGSPDGVDEGFRDDLLGLLLQAEDVPSLTNGYAMLVAEEAFATADASLMAGLAFARRLQTCDGASALGMSGRCTWGGVARDWSERDADEGSLDYDERTTRVSFGTQFQTDEGLSVGGGLSYETGDLSAGSAVGDIRRIQVGAVVSGDLGGGHLGLSASWNWFDADLSRTVSTPTGLGTAEGDVSGSIGSLTLRYHREVAAGPTLTFFPALEAGVHHIRQDRYSETGAGDFGMQVNGFSDTVFTLAPSLGMRANTQIADNPAQVTAHVGLLGTFGDDWSSEARLNGANGTDGFGIRSDPGSVAATLGAGLTVRFSEGASFDAGLDAIVSDRRRTLSARMGLQVHF
ncbi:autotransporter outer membrane beta-barrel domain-containing protein, partial [Jannaschia sp.]|nr:autotransporter outer membrane beta-barrel domain-containing protein [Jannaschia sp.]